MINCTLNSNLSSIITTQYPKPRYLGHRGGVITISTRSINSKLALVKSLKELMSLIPFSKISIDEIVRNCNLSRQTFYKYFYDKYDLLSFVYEMETKYIIEQYHANKDFVELTSEFMAFNRSNKIFLKLVMDSPNAFLNFYNAFSERFMIGEIGEKRITTELLVAINLFHYGSVSVMYKWLSDHIKSPQDEMAYLIVKSMPNVLKPYFQISI